MKCLLLLCLSLLFTFVNATNQENFDVVQISIKTASYDAEKPPTFARVKYNKLCPLVVTSDDMGRGEFIRNWAFLNGYPVFGNSSYGQMDKVMTLLDAPYNDNTLTMVEKDMASEPCVPLTYTDGTGGLRRFAVTSAIMPYKIGAQYTYINKEQAKAMVRTGWSFAQHDVADGITAEDRETFIAEQFASQSKIMEDITGAPIKILVEPNGDHSYIGASLKSEEICWNIFQNATSEYPALSTLIEDWTTGIMFTDFTSKPKGATERFFFQGKEKTWFEQVRNADGEKIILGGTHGLGNDVLRFLRDEVQPTDKYWVASADEVWEYYYLYNNSKIENINYVDGLLTFEVKMPKYKKHQFRELTINIPGVTVGTECQFSGNVVTGGARQCDNFYMVNLGIEENVLEYIEELIKLYRNNQHNSYIKRDAQYLIDRLLPGNQKEQFQSQLDAAPKYSYKVTTSLGDILAEGFTDADTTIWYSYPKYLLNGTDLYMANANASKPYYVGNLSLSKEVENVIVDYSKVGEKVIFFSEGEDIEGTTPNTTSYDKINQNSGQAFALQHASNGIGGIVSKSIAITTVSPGRYNLVAAAGDSWNDATHYAIFTFKLGDNVVYTFQTDYKGVKEYKKDNIVVSEECLLSVEATGSGVSRWLDYLYIQNSDANDTGVKWLQTEMADFELYSLDGLKTVSPSKGVYIIKSVNAKINGKKIVFK